MKNQKTCLGNRLKKWLLSGIAASPVEPTALLFGGLTIGVLSLAAPNARALDLYSNGPLNINLTTTIEYSGGERVNNPSTTMMTNANANDGDQNFQHGLVSSQFEVLPTLSVTDGNFGVHISGQAYIDPLYLSSNQNGSPSTVNYFVSNNQEFPRATANINGRNAELLDAFAYDSVDFGAGGNQSVTLKVGRQTLLWGQSLFFTGNGIAAGQAPIDINKATTLANPEAQQIFMPVGQVVLTYQPNQVVTLQGYYQFEWRPDQFPGIGSYFAGQDFIGPGAGRLILGPTPFGPLYLGRAHDLTPPSENGQFGLAAKFQLGDYDLGFYGLRFDDKSPQVYANPGAPGFPGPQGIPLGTYQLAYARDIQIYGASLSTTVGPVNVAGEISTRRNQDLYSSVAPAPVGFYNESSNPGWAVGNTLNAQASAIYITPGLPLMPGGMSLLGEVEANRVIAVTANKAALVSGRTANAMGLQGVASPNYYNVLPNLNLNFPVGFTWYPTGRSQFDSTEQAGTGSVNVGITGSYKTVWQAGITYTDYLGSTSIIAPGKSKQGFADRGYVSFYINRTF